MEHENNDGRGLAKAATRVQIPAIANGNFMQGDIRSQIKAEVSKVRPFDDLEREHINDVISWIDSGVQIFRIQKPDKPPKHLVSYFVLIDTDAKSLLLVDHLKAQKWLPPGGHVELNEHPKDTVNREIREELGKDAKYFGNYDSIFFVTEAQTVGLTAGHTDVSLWYILEGIAAEPLEFDKTEFKAIRWFGFDDVLNTPIERLDPHLHRFVGKLKQWFNEQEKRT